MAAALAVWSLTAANLATIVGTFVLVWGVAGHQLAKIRLRVHFTWTTGELQLMALFIAVVAASSMTTILVLQANHSLNERSIYNQMIITRDQTQIEHNQDQIEKNQQAICAAIPECLLKGAP